MKNQWTKRKLRELADINASNVDKKIYKAEQAVSLCNYMDVYANDYITTSIDFMHGSATQAEIQRFQVKKGDVIITKDSESPDDIGVPAIVIDEIPNLVCGYHLCLIHPKNEKINSIYLAKQLGTFRAIKYFSIHASGSTRFGLPINAIENFEIDCPPLSEQTKIAEMLSTVDKAIAETEELIAKQQRIKTGLMQDLLTRGIDKNGNLRSEETHQFKDSPLGRIPTEWEVSEIKSCSFVTKLAGFEFTNYFDYAQGGDVIALRALNIKNEQLDLSDVQYISRNISNKLPRSKINANDILITYIGAYIGDILRIEENDKYHLAPNIAKIVAAKSLFPPFLEIYLRSELVQKQIKNLTAVTATPSLTMGQIRKLLIAFPIMLKEQQNIYERINKISEFLLSLDFQLKKLKRQKAGLMQDLLTGKKRVAPLLENSPIP